MMISEKIALCRKTLGISQEELAALLIVGVVLMIPGVAGLIHEYRRED